MRITAITWGSEGDCRPIVSLCRGLAAAGHDVVLLAERSTASYADVRGIRFVPLAGDMVARSRETLAHGDRRKFATTNTKLLLAMVREHAGEWLAPILEQSRDADLIVTSALAVWAGLACAEALRLPVAIASFYPARETREFASPFLPPEKVPAWANRISHRMVLAAMQVPLRKAIDDARRDVARLGPWKPRWNEYPLLLGVSPELVPPPRDWPSHFSIVGYWWPAGDDVFEPDAELATFLGAGEPPVFVGFGSMVGSETARFQALVLDALAGRRALLSRGWGGWDEGALPSTVRVIGSMPYAWLLPRVATAVHHGGAGTSHSAARAGVPSVVLSFAADQPFWADRLHRAGVAPPGIAQRRVTAAALAAALRAADDGAMRARAKAVGARMNREDGVRDAIARLEQVVAEFRGR